MPIMNQELKDNLSPIANLQNPFDDPHFFKAYAHYRKQPLNLNDSVEQPALRSCLPIISGLNVLDVGCGFGDFCKFADESGASGVVGVDISLRMIETARDLSSGEKIRFINAPIECFEHKGSPFDLIISSLALHYVQNLEPVLRRLRLYLKNDGRLIFSVNHPFYTSSVHVDNLDEHGIRTTWTLDHYHSEGARLHSWLGHRVLKYHRTLTTYLECIHNAGFQLKRLLEPRAVQEARTKSGHLSDVDRHPVILLMACEPVRD